MSLRTLVALLALLCASSQGCTKGQCNTASDCIWGNACSADHVCTFASGGSDVVMIGGLAGDGYNYGYAVSMLASPLKTAIGFDQSYFGPMDGAFLAPDGQLLYKHWLADWNDSEIREFVADPVGASGAYPANPMDNDPVRATSRCSTSGTMTWIMQDKTGALMYGCPAPDGNTAAPFDFYDTSGTLRVRRRAILLWTGNGDMLVNAADATYDLAVLSATGVQTAVSGLPSYADTQSVQAKRVHGDAFWIVFQNATATELWEISARGVAARVGAYAEQLGQYPQALDSAGAIYGIENDPNARPNYPDGLVVRLPLAPGVKSVVMRDQDYPIHSSASRRPSFTTQLLMPCW